VNLECRSEMCSTRLAESTGRNHFISKRVVCVILWYHTYTTTRPVRLKRCLKLQEIISYAGLLQPFSWH